MPVNRFLIPILALVALLGTVLSAQAMGIWTTSGRVAVNAGELKVAEIKGWMTLQQVIDGLPIVQNELYAIGKIPADVPPSTALKDLEPLAPDFSVSALRDALSARESAEGAGANAVVDSPPPQPQAAATSAPAPVATVEKSEPQPGSHAGITPTPLPVGEVLPANQIKGKMSLREVSAQCAVPLDGLLVALDLPADTGPDTLIKDLVSQGKLGDVTTVQQAVAGLQK